MTFDPEFKKALQLLPEAEKDKLILRLLKHNLSLANKLRFELVDTDSVQDKREQMQQRITEAIELASTRFYSPGYMLMDVRNLSGEINEHVSITKDKYGEISLNSFMLRQLLTLNNERIASHSLHHAHTLCVYIVARIFKILMLIQKQHEDLHIDFKEDIQAIGKLVGNNPNIMRIAMHNGLDVNWLIQFEVPNDIADIYKSLRENGFLK